MDEELKNRGINCITSVLYQGGYPYDDDFSLLRRAGITHLFNVDLPYLDKDAVKAFGFSETLWKAIIDGRRIPDADFLDTLNSLHTCVIQPDSKVYIHCHAGIQRSATILWLYLVACGLDPEQTTDAILLRAPRTIPGHPALYDAKLLELARDLGSKRFLPHKRPEALVLI